MFVIFFEIIAH